MNHPSLSSLYELDVRHLWHPYTDIPRHERMPEPVVTHAEGIYLHTEDGRRLIDGIASWWCVALGHGQPRIVEAIQRQAGRLQHSILGGLTHPPAIELAARLAALAPGDLNHVHFASDGASAVECALKVALQYWHNLGQPRRKKFVCLEKGYHGDTLGAIGVGYIPSFHVPFAGAVIPGLRAQSPYDPLTPPGHGLASCAPGSLESMARILDEHHEEVAAVIIEPVIQGAAGAWIYPAEYVGWLRAECDRHGLLLIADEIAVGLGRTGRLLACDHAGVVPDLLCLGKALTGGTLPLSAMLATDAIYDAFRSTAEADRMLYHGHTFCGNPITAAAALAALDVFEEERVIERSAPAAARLAEGMARLVDRHDVLRQARAFGMVGMAEILPEAGGARLGRRIGDEALALGLFSRPLEGSVYLWPPLVSTPAQIDEMLAILDEAILRAVAGPDA